MRNQHITPPRQRGMTLIGWATVLGLIAFFVLLTLRVLPIYMEHHKVKSTLKSLEDEPYVTQKSNQEIWKLLSNRFYINDVKIVTSDHVVIEKGHGKMHITIAYERREKVIGNLDVVVSFEDELDLVAN